MNNFSPFLLLFHRYKWLKAIKGTRLPNVHHSLSHSLSSPVMPPTSSQIPSSAFFCKCLSCIINDVIFIKCSNIQHYQPLQSSLTKHQISIPSSRNHLTSQVIPPSTPSSKWIARLSRHYV